MSWAQYVFQFDSFKPRDATTASWHACPSQQFFNTLFFWRTVALFLSLGTCIANVLHQFKTVDQHAEPYLLGFTNLGFVLLAAYFLVATLLSFTDWRRKRYAYFVSVPGANSTTESLLFGNNTMEDDDQESRTPLFRIFFWVMFEISFTTSIFVDIVFWTTFYSGTADVFVVLLHALNGIFMMGELFLNSLVFIPGHVIFVWFTFLAYIIEAYVWHAVADVWAYPFLDFSNKLAMSYYPALFVTATVTFFTGFLLVKLRDRRKRRNSYRNVVQQDFIF